MLDELFAERAVCDVLRFTGLKAVGEKALEEVEVRRLMLSSSATVYGDRKQMPFHERLPPGTPTNRLMAEEVLRDLARADARWPVAPLHYFNPVGAHESGRIGEDLHGIPNNRYPISLRWSTADWRCSPSMATITPHAAAPGWSSET